MVWTEKTTIDGLPYYWETDTEEITWNKPVALMTAQEKEDDSGEWFWIPHSKQLWQPARVLNKGPKGTLCQTRSGSKVTIPSNNIVNDGLSGGRELQVEFWPVKLAQLNRPEEDLVQMETVNDASIINNIRVRYEDANLYTWVGAARSVLISVNPYKMLPLYGPEKINLYRNKPPNTHLPPHVYDIANDSYNSLLFDNMDQSVLISGESGAGKTVCTKQCLDFLAKVAGSDKSLIEEKIVIANPLLEAFGNAQTIRNNNSSRFGKWIEVHFDSRERRIVSARIINYLLEKSRLVYQQKGERNYHIFYQMTTDATCQNNYGLQSPENYNYLKMSGTFKANLIDDAEEFKQVLEAFSLLNFSEEEKDFVLSVTAGLLVLGNCEFKAKAEKNGVAGSELVDKAPMKHAAKLLGMKSKDLKKVLSYRSIAVRGQTSTIPLDPMKAKSAKDSFAMGIYSRLFDFLVRKINTSLDGKRGKFIGILDIFGFEIFDQNSFEQLCINFANEKLQQQFNRTTFKEEEELYLAEGIDFKHVEFIDNQGVLDMIEQKPRGILPLLDDECKIPEGSDIKFMNKMEEYHKGGDKFQTDKQRKLKDSFNFEIVHYAGVVKYNGENFLMKNTDNLYADMYSLCENSESVHMQSMFPKIDNRQLKSLSSQFRKQLNELMEGLYKTESRYIRCVKPNGQQRPDAFDAYLVIDQLRYSGVFEAVEIRKQGFPFRYKFPQFACRYGCVNRIKKHVRYKNNSKRNPSALCKEILSSSKQDFSGCVFGKTMVLFKTSEFSTLELLRNLALERIIPIMQSVMRGHLAREMKRRCFKLESSLKKALRKGNDLSLLQTELSKVDGVLGEMASIFPGVLPRNLKEAKEHERNLLEWVKVEKKLVRFVDGSVNLDDVAAYTEAAKWIDKGVALRKRGIPETSSQSEVMKAAVKARKNSKLGKIDAESQKFLDFMHLSKMQDVVERANRLGYSSEVLSDIQDILGKSEIEKVKLELQNATEKGDKKRQIHREIRLFELELESSESQFRNVEQFSKLRDPMVYAKSTLMGKIFGAEKKAAQMMTFTKSMTLTSLTQFKGIVDKPQEKSLLKTAKNISKDIRIYMGDKSSSLGTVEVAGEMMQLALASNAYGMVDETYMQVIKQLRGNPSEESLSRGYELLAMLLNFAKPSEECLKYTFVFIKNQGKELRRFYSFWHELKYGNVSNSPSGSMLNNTAQELNNGAGVSRYALLDGEDSGPSASY